MASRMAQYEAPKRRTPKNAVIHEASFSVRIHYEDIRWEYVELKVNGSAMLEFQLGDKRHKMSLDSKFDHEYSLVGFAVQSAKDIDNLPKNWPDGNKQDRRLVLLRRKSERLTLMPEEGKPCLDMIIWFHDLEELVRFMDFFVKVFSKQNLLFNFGPRSEVFEIKNEVMIQKFNRKEAEKRAQNNESRRSRAVVRAERRDLSVQDEERNQNIQENIHRRHRSNQSVQRRVGRRTSLKE